MDNDNLARIYEWLGYKLNDMCEGYRTRIVPEDDFSDVYCTACRAVYGCGDHDTAPELSDALEAQIRRKLNSELCRVEYWYPNGSVGIKGPSIRSYGNTIYDAVLEYLRVANNG